MAWPCTGSLDSSLCSSPPCAPPPLHLLQGMSGMLYAPVGRGVWRRAHAHLLRHVLYGPHGPGKHCPDRGAAEPSCRHHDHGPPSPDRTGLSTLRARGRGRDEACRGLGARDPSPAISGRGCKATVCRGAGGTGIYGAYFLNVCYVVRMGDHDPPENRRVSLAECAIRHAQRQPGTYRASDQDW